MSAKRGASTTSHAAIDPVNVGCPDVAARIEQRGPFVLSVALVICEYDPDLDNSVCALGYETCCLEINYSESLQSSP